MGLAVGTWNRKSVSRPRRLDAVSTGIGVEVLSGGLGSATHSLSSWTRNFRRPCEWYSLDILSTQEVSKLLLLR